jgi:hypothetical protein
LNLGSCGTTYTTTNQFNGTGPTPTPGPHTATPTITNTPAPQPTVVVNGITYTNCSISQPSSNSETQAILAQGTGLDYTMVSANCGSALTVTLPPGATPVTAYLYVEYNNGGADVAANTTAIQFNGSNTGTGV